MTEQGHTRTEQLHATAATPEAVARPTFERLAGHYLPDLVYGANDGIITTFAVV